MQPDEFANSANPGFTLPFVSIIVPVCNDAHRVRNCVEALIKQTYPSEKYEVVVVDNGSTDGTRDVIQKYPVTLLTEDRIYSSYVARNTGLRHAQGEVIAFTDSDCTPVPEWIEEGVRCLQSQSADLVGGKVRFVYSLHQTGAEIWDSLTNMQIEQNIRERNVAKTANLFVWATVIKHLGPFPNNIRSGGDVIWTKRATENGFKLVYAPAAEVDHPARQLAALWKKQYRVGKGQIAIWRADDLPFQESIRRIVGHFLPPRPSRIELLLQNHDCQVNKHRVWSIWLAAWLMRVSTGLGHLVVSLKFSRRQG